VPEGAQSGRKNTPVLLLLGRAVAFWLLIYGRMLWLKGRVRGNDEPEKMRSQFLFFKVFSSTRNQG
jgi:hypothetical protein